MLKAYKTRQNFEAEVRSYLSRLETENYESIMRDIVTQKRKCERKWNEAQDRMRYLHLYAKFLGAEFRQWVNSEQMREIENKVKGAIANEYSRADKIDEMQQATADVIVRQTWCG